MRKALGQTHFQNLDERHPSWRTSATMTESQDQEVVRTPLPVSLWLAPFLGHVGACREDGVILDFAGSYYGNIDGFASGAAARFVHFSHK
ncbi:hypothetical protein L7F22_038229 [Adiantum nelumboides]|nr:hypothetical protein [Adiantum nelumboides]